MLIQTNNRGKVFNFFVCLQLLMCSVSIMPADYEMLISHSPPVFSHSPPSNFLTNYSPYRLHCDNYARTLNRGSYKQPPPSLSINTRYETKYDKPETPTSPIRPCLVSRGEDSIEEDLSPTKSKKKVVFADDRGMKLTHIRFMTEPSSVPPLWSSKFLAQVTKGLSAEVVPEPWEVTFSQPASDYVDFRRKLDQDYVSLENVIVKESEECVLGTIKVRNLSFHKEVFVRVTSDDWKTHENVFCKFVNNNASMQANSGHYVLYDTFSFRITLQPKSKRLEFCVCFRCDDKEYWDNNGGKNYVLLKKVIHGMSKSHSADELLDKNVQKMHRTNSETNELNHHMKCADALQAKLESWSEFASWTHLENNTPYW